MRRRALDFLVCPVDLTPLAMLVIESRKTTLSGDQIAIAKKKQIEAFKLEEDIITGVLVNEQLGICYPIEGGVPRLLCYPTPRAAAFARKHRKWLEDNGTEWRAPTGSPPPGELSVLSSFSTEWTRYEIKDDVFWHLTPDAWFAHMSSVLGLRHLVSQHSLVLEVGIGAGFAGNKVSIEHDCEVFGMDLGYSVDVARRHFLDNPFFHVVQASAFSAPFPDRTFDCVYSFGALHHTYSTKDAIVSVARLPKPNGKLSVWVYGFDNEKRSVKRILLAAIEKVVRPVISRLPTWLQTLALLPTVPVYILHQALRVWFVDRNAAHYGFNEALHAARDRLTPRFAHRHTERELAGWFRELGYEGLNGAKDFADALVPDNFRENVVMCGTRAVGHEAT